jgi:hypothetical protein
MTKRAGRKLVALVACGALSLAAALPASGVADTGGVPHTTKPCKPKAHGNGPKHEPRNTHGRKCGFHRVSDPVTTPGDDGSDDGTGDGDVTEGDDPIV